MWLIWFSTRFKDEEWGIPWWWFWSDLEIWLYPIKLRRKNFVLPDLRIGTSLTGHDEDLGAVTTRRPPGVKRQITWWSELSSDWSPDQNYIITWSELKQKLTDRNYQIPKKRTYHANYLFASGWRRKIETLVKAKAFHCPTLLKEQIKAFTVRSCWKNKLRLFTVRPS